MPNPELIRAICPFCTTGIGVRPDQIGRRLRCPSPSCKRTFSIDLADDPEPPVDRQASERDGSPSDQWVPVDDANEILPSFPHSSRSTHAKITATFPYACEIVFEAVIQAVRIEHCKILQIDRTNRHMRFSFTLPTGRNTEHDLFVFSAVGGASDVDITSQELDQNYQFDPLYQIILKELCKFLLFAPNSGGSSPSPQHQPFQPTPSYSHPSGSPNSSYLPPPPRPTPSPPFNDSTPRFSNIPFDLDEEVNEPEEDSDDTTAWLRRRKRKQTLERVWRLTTFVGLALSLVSFFMPWTRVSLWLNERIALRSDIDCGTQSGFQMIFAGFSFSPALEPIVKAATVEQEVELRRRGVDPDKERAEATLSHGAFRLLCYPFGLLAAGLIVLVSRPTRTTLWLVCGALIAVWIISFAPFAGGSPTEATIASSLAKEYGIYGALMALRFDFHYTFGFYLAILSVSLTIVGQIVFLLVDPDAGTARRRW